MAHGKILKHYLIYRQAISYTSICPAAEVTASRFNVMLVRCCGTLSKATSVLRLRKRNMELRFSTGVNGMISLSFLRTGSWTKRRQRNCARRVDKLLRRQIPASEIYNWN